MSGNGFFRTSTHNHAVGDGSGASRQRLGRFFHVHQTHAAVGGNTQFFVITEVRHVDPGVMGSLNDHAAFRGVNFNAIDGEFYHYVVLAYKY